MVSQPATGLPGAVSNFVWPADRELGVSHHLDSRTAVELKLSSGGTGINSPPTGIKSAIAAAGSDSVFLPSLLPGLCCRHRATASRQYQLGCLDNTAVGDWAHAGRQKAEVRLNFTFAIASC